MPDIIAISLLSESVSLKTIRIEPVECNVRTMQNLITRNELDLGLITLAPAQKDENTYIHMEDEEIFLAVPSCHPLAVSGSEQADTAPELSLSRFSQDPFILITRRSTMFQLEESLFAVAGFEPQVLFSTSSNVSKYRMVLAEVGCALLPGFFAKPDPGLRYFRLEGKPAWEVTMCCRKGAYLNQAEQYFLELCRDYWKSQKLTRHAET